MRGLLTELRRRNVHRAALAYIAGCWLLVQLAQTMSEIYEFDPAIIRWLITAMLIGFVPAMIASWVFEWRGGQMLKQSEADSVPTSAASSRALDRVIIAVLAAAVLVFSLDKFLGDETLSPSPTDFQTLAVLPFDDMTASQDQSWFADGLAEELLNVLASNDAIRVVARTSSFSFRGRDDSAQVIGRELGVGHLLQGSVRRDGDAMRVTVQLIDVATGFSIWSETYDDDWQSVFDVQDRIAARIAGQLQVRALSGRQSPRAKPEAYALYLKGRFAAQQGGQEQLERAATYLRESAEIDPEFAPTWASLSAVYGNLAGQSLRPREETFALARAAAEQAVEVDPEYWGGYSQLAWIAHRYDGDLGSAVSDMQRAIDRGSGGVPLYGRVAVLLLQLGRLEEAIKALEYCAERSPVSPTAHYNLGMAYKYANRLEAAERSFRRTLTLNTEYRSARYSLGEVLLLLGRVEDAQRAWSVDDYVSTQMGRVVTTFELDGEDAGLAALESFTVRWGDTWPSTVADVHAWRGDLDSAFEWIEKDIEKYGSAGWGELRLNRFFDSLHEDPRWPRLLERMGVSDEQLAAYTLESRLD
ncbi:MAG: tetratricopeptide repeat protein [Pseudomonadota bacterium]